MAAVMHAGDGVHDVDAAAHPVRAVHVVHADAVGGDGDVVMPIMLLMILRPAQHSPGRSFFVFLGGRRPPLNSYPQVRGATIVYIIYVSYSHYSFIVCCLLFIIRWHDELAIIGDLPFYVIVCDLYY